MPSLPAIGRRGLPVSIALLALGLAIGAIRPQPAAGQTDPAQVGQWSAVQSWPAVAVHAHLLPTGKVLFWAYSDGIRLWDPATGAITNAASAGRNVFCSGHSFLSDGRLIVPGGHDRRNGRGLASCSIYNPVTNTWTATPNMNDRRWYPSSTTLSNGDVLVTSGSKDVRYTNNTLSQVYQTATNSWRSLTSAVLALPLYPHTFLAPDGRVFFATQTSRYLNTAGTGSWSTVANNLVGGRDNYGSSVLYDDGKVMRAGGADPPTATCEVIDLGASTPQWSFTGAMATPRRQHNLTLLPDGQVLVTGGSSAAGFNEPSGAVHTAELWNPATGAWTTLASCTRYRGYHSTAVLLPDGRVLSAGGDNEPNAEVFSPPYLFQGARPVISSAPSSVTYGQQFQVGSADAGTVTAVNWIRLGSLTHAQNWDQRINRLAFSASGSTLTVTAPTNPNLCPPGYYILFLLRNGVPSVGAIVRIS